MKIHQTLRQKYFRDRLQISLLTLRKFKRINQTLFPLKSLENQRFSDGFRGNRGWLIRLNLLNTKSEICRQSLNVSLISKSGEIPVWKWFFKANSWATKTTSIDNVLVSVRQQNNVYWRYCIVFIVDFEQVFVHFKRT